MSTTPPGWYDDGHGALRWWDGAQWTEHVHVPDAAPVKPAGPWSSGQGPAPEKPKSKLWILWVVLGGVLLLFVVAAAILIPLLIGWLSALPAAQGGDGADEQAAVAAVELYDDAWDDGDCRAYEESTTAAYRESIDIVDCEAFATESDYFDETTDEYDMVVTDVRTGEDGSIEVVTRETYLSLVDEEGTPLSEPEQVADSFRYVVIAAEGGWAIDALDYDE
jgi:hypothetical protein